MQFFITDKIKDNKCVLTTPTPDSVLVNIYINFLCIYFIFLHFLLIFLIFWLQWINFTVVATGLDQYERLKPILLKFRHIVISMVQIMVLWELLGMNTGKYPTRTFLPQF